MRTLLLGRKMKATDAKTIQEIGIPSMVLMERAAMAVAAQADSPEKLFFVEKQQMEEKYSIPAAFAAYTEYFKHRY